LLPVLCKLINQYGPVMRLWLGPLLIIAVTTPKQAEAVMGSNAHLRKACFYKNITPWLGTGLLTSSGKKWRAHRKMLTPSFHFEILKQFMEVFNRNGDILVRRLSSHVDGPQFDVTSYITMCTLDVICESTMGVSVKAQTGGSAEFVSSITRLTNAIVERSLKPWWYNNTIFALSTLKRVQDKCLAVLHDRTNSVIKTRKQELLAGRGVQNMERSKDDEFGKDGLGFQKLSNGRDLRSARVTVSRRQMRHTWSVKGRMSCFELRYADCRPLIQTSAVGMPTKSDGNSSTVQKQASQDGDPLTDLEIREEVDTFMFEGHDTTASCCLFTLWALAKHQDVQDNVVAELRAVLGDSDRAASFSDLNEMKYLEQVIKESLRLYPSVPLFGRELTEDIVVDGYVLPAGANIVFLPFSNHRNPQYFPDPEKFDPDRFLPENCIGRHPYSYIPFAAGPRNCIGQKFAMLELKSLLSKILRNYKLCPGDPDEELKFVLELVLRSQKGIRLKLERRNR
ncbi:hypothetical protein Cfor_09045, partial [Coptotermes formosanus]